MRVPSLNLHELHLASVRAHIGLLGGDLVVLDLLQLLGLLLEGFLFVLGDGVADVCSAACRHVPRSARVEGSMGVNISLGAPRQSCS